MIFVDGLSSTPVFEQIRSQFAAQISDGTLAPGARLPTVRRLAADMGLAVNTVARAYRELEAAGLVTARARAGTVVADTAGRTRHDIHAEAARYAVRARALGVDPVEAHKIVAAALGVAAPESSSRTS